MGTGMVAGVAKGEEIDVRGRGERAAIREALGRGVDIGRSDSA